MLTDAIKRFGDSPNSGFAAFLIFFIGVFPYCAAFGCDRCSHRSSVSVKSGAFENRKKVAYKRYRTYDIFCFPEWLFSRELRYIFENVKLFRIASLDLRDGLATSVKLKVKRGEDPTESFSELQRPRHIAR